MKRQTAVVAALVVAVSVLLSAQNQEFARIIRNGDVATLTAFGPRPVDLAAKQLADEFRIAVNVEDPVYMYRDDVQDITTPAASRAGRRLLIPRTAFLEVGFRLRQDDALQDVQQMVHDLADAANAQLPFQYRVDNDDDVFTLVATRSRDVQGRAIELTPLLDHRITIPLGTRTLIAHVQLLVRDLEQQTGFRIGCCQGAVGGVPWGEHSRHV